MMIPFILEIIAFIVVIQVVESKKLPLVITSKVMLQHRGTGPFVAHPECPERISACLPVLDKLVMDGIVRTREFDASNSRALLDEALGVINCVHDSDYVKHMESMCKRGARILDPWIEDTYICRDSYDVGVAGQAMWIEAVKHALESNGIAFALTRPPGHHVTRNQAMGFGLFNFACGAAAYYLQQFPSHRVGIIDFDVHFGNGVADYVRQKTNICYASLHQEEIFPYGEGKREDKGQYNNLLCIPLPSNTKYFPLYAEKLQEAVGFVADFQPDFVIVCAGYDALAGDPLASLQLFPADYGEMVRVIRRQLGERLVFGLEGGYGLSSLPVALGETLRACAE